MSTGFIALSNHGTLFQPARFFVADEMTLQPAARSNRTRKVGERPPLARLQMQGDSACASMIENIARIRVNWQRVARR